jgi:hypothetical protein
MAVTISDEQRRLNSDLHSQRPDFGSKGGAGHQSVIAILQRFEQLGAIASVLDYGTGKGLFPKTLKQAIPALKVGAYDPAVEAFSRKPSRRFDLVTSFDVLEHVERGSITAVLEEIRDLSSKLVYLQIDLQPAVKRLGSGRNAHILLAPPDWWLAQIAAVFPVQGSFPIFHESGAIQKLAVVAATTPESGALVWPFLMKLHKVPMVISGGYLGESKAKSAKVKPNGKGG